MSPTICSPASTRKICRLWLVCAMHETSTHRNVCCTHTSVIMHVTIYLSVFFVAQRFNKHVAFNLSCR